MAEFCTCPESINKGINGGEDRGGECKRIGECVKTGESRNLSILKGKDGSHWRRKWQTTPVFLPGEFHGYGSLEGYSPWVTKSQTRLSD